MYEMQHFVHKIPKIKKGFPDKLLDFCAYMQINVFLAQKKTYTMTRIYVRNAAFRT